MVGILKLVGLIFVAFKLIVRLLPAVAALVAAAAFLTWYASWLLVIKTMFALLISAATHSEVLRLLRANRAWREQRCGEKGAIKVAQIALCLLVPAIYSPALAAWGGVLHGVVLETADPWWFTVPSIGLSVMVLVAYGFYLELQRDISRVGIRPPRVIWSPKSLRH